MNVGSISAGFGAPDIGVDTSRLKQSTAASDFESLLIAQMLKSTRSEGSGWLGTGEDQSSDAAFGLGEEELARAMASTGGFGLAKLIEAGLSKAANATQASGPSVAPPPD